MTEFGLPWARVDWKAVSFRAKSREAPVEARRPTSPARAESLSAASLSPARASFRNLSKIWRYDYYTLRKLSNFWQ